MDTNPITIHDLTEGAVAGKGVKLSTIINERKKLIAIRFEHSLEGGGVCSKIVPVRQKHKGRGWSIKVDRKTKVVTLSPSLVCAEHAVHGWIRKGHWLSTLEEFLSLPDRETERRIEDAKQLAEEYGGGEYGALLALAAGERVLNDMSQLERTVGQHGVRGDPVTTQ